MSKAGDSIEVWVGGERKMAKVAFVDPFLFRMAVKLGEELVEVQAVDVVAGGKDILNNWFVPALQVNFLEKLPKLVALQIFQGWYLSCGESLNHTTLSHYY